MLIDSHVHLFPDRLAAAIRAWFDVHAWDIQYRESAEAAWLRLAAGGIDRAVVLPYVQGSLVSRIHSEGEVLTERHEEDGTHLQARVGPGLAAELTSYHR